MGEEGVWEHGGMGVWQGYGAENAGWVGDWTVGLRGSMEVWECGEEASVISRGGPKREGTESRNPRHYGRVRASADMGKSG